MNALKEFDQLKELSWDDKVAILAMRLKWLESQVSPPPAPLTHRFERGLYIRTMFLAADTVFIGRKHLRGHEVHLLKGRATYVTKRGKFETSAPYSIFTAPGFSMVAVIHEPCVVETWHQNPENSRDVDALELRDFEPSELMFARGRVAEDRLDYQHLTRELDEKALFKLYGPTSDLFEEGSPSVEIKDSPRGGVGMFVTQDCGVGDYIGLMHRGNRRTLLGRWTNHGLRANARLQKKGNEVHLFAQEHIKKGEELTINYRVAFQIGASLCQV